MEYKFVHKDKEYILAKENCEGIFFEDESEITGLSIDIILDSLNDGEEVNFTNEYYGNKCTCNSQEPINKSYRYLEYHFFIYTKNNEYIINTICKDYKDTSFNKLFSLGKVDDSYIISISVCPNCGLYSIYLDQCTV